MPISIVFQHGWGFDHRFFEPLVGVLAERLHPSTRFFVLDQGYGGEPRALPQSAFLDAKVRIVVAHSFGLHLVTPILAHGVTMVVAISSFAGFCEDHGVSGTLEKRLVQRMQNRLARDAEGCLQEFQANCFGLVNGQEAPPEWRAFSGIDKYLLLADLGRLSTERLTAAQFEKVDQALILHGAADTIVSADRAEELSKVLPQAEVRILDGAPHALPYLHPEWCAGMIEQAISSIEV